MPVNYTETARCLGCGYALRGLIDERCPECGRAFDPADWRTMKIKFPGNRPPRRDPPLPMDDYARAVLAPMRWPGRIYPWVTIALLLLDLLWAGPPDVPVVLWLGLLLAVGIPIVRRRAIDDYGQPDAMLRVDRKMSVRLRLWAYTSLILVFFQVPFRLTMWMSVGPSMQATADRLYSQPTWEEHPAPRWIGVYYCHIHVEPEGVSFTFPRWGVDSDRPPVIFRPIDMPDGSIRLQPVIWEPRSASFIFDRLWPHLY